MLDTTRRIPLAIALLSTVLLIHPESSSADQFFTIDASNLPVASATEILLQPATGDIHRDVLDADVNGTWRSNGRLLLRLTDDVTPTSQRIGLRSSDKPALEFFPITAEMVSQTKESEALYWESRAADYAILANRQLPGGSLFRSYLVDATEHLDVAARKRMKSRTDVLAANVRWRRRGFDREDTMGMLSGGRALQENLQLDVVLAPDHSVSQTTVTLASVRPVTTKAIDWKPYLKDVGEVRLDGLATCLPSDNLAVFLPSFDSLTALIDKGEVLGNSLADAAMQRATNQHTRERLERQLLLPLDGFARALGSTAVGEIALCADDLYLVDGTGVAVVMRAKNPTLLINYVKSAHDVIAKKNAGVKLTSGEFDGTHYFAAANDLRSVSSYAMELKGGIVVVGNSLPLLQRIANVHAGVGASIASLDEYRFFRSRYIQGEEDAFVLMTDEAIRKWTGPRWRIAQSRRVRAAAALADTTVRHRDELLGVAKNDEKSITTAWVFTGPTEILREGGSYRQREYGSLDFMTPIAELNFDMVTPAEAAEYNRFRDNFQRRWTRNFDPIAIQIRAKEGVELDTTIMPLIGGSDYAEIIDLTGGGTLAEGAGDRHDGEIAHAIWHLNPEGRTIKQFELSTLNILAVPDGALSWIDGTFEVYADDGDFWNSGRTDLYWQAPIAIRVGVKKPMALAATLTALRGYVESSAPNLATWTLKKHGDVAYTQVAEGSSSSGLLFYHSDATALTISLREDVLLRAIDRSTKRKSATTTPTNPQGEWLGGSVAAHFSQGSLQTYMRFFSEDVDSTIREEAYANIPILNEWKKLYPDRDPVEVHRQIFGTTLECPGGKGYQWNEALHTMESVVLGSPGDRRGEAMEYLPKLGDVDAGVTFENDGLRARVRVADEKKP